MNSKSIWLHTLVIGSFIAIQSTLLKNISIKGITPDIAFVILVFSVNYQGAFKGQITGFITGLLKDFLSVSPLGFHAFIHVVIASMLGSIKGKIFIDPILVPVLMVTVSTFLKRFFGFILMSIFSHESAGQFFSIALLIEIGINAFLAPFVYALMKAVSLIRPREREEY
ncbi:MAG TPA: rod shape-determining protein MreD [Spirochaetia bacterium]|jgi:rod shape-determining protein MreD|nr:rod shape-determining protein MreD [Spirochaetia bacterium]